MYRTAAAGTEQQEDQTERHSSVGFRAGFSFTVRKGASVSHRLRAGKEHHQSDRQHRSGMAASAMSVYRTATSVHHGQKFRKETSSTNSISEMEKSKMITIGIQTGSNGTITNKGGTRTLHEIDQTYRQHEIHRQRAFRRNRHNDARRSYSSVDF